jgi:hypothetical protein
LRIHSVSASSWLAAMATVVVILSTTSANALILSAEFDFDASTAQLEPLTPNIGNGLLVAGEIIVLNIVVDNAPGDVIAAIFATMTWNTTEVAYIGGGLTGQILTEDSCTGFSCTPQSLQSNGSAPTFKPFSPFAQSTGVTDWLQVVAHTNPMSISGIGPDIVANLAFEILPGGAGTGSIFFRLLIEPNSDVIAGENGGPFLGSTTLIGAITNIPEPGTAVLVCLGLIGLGARRRASR